MPLQRFIALKRYVCFYDIWKKNETKDPSFKINYFIDTIIRKSKSLYLPE